MLKGCTIASTKRETSDDKIDGRRKVFFLIPMIKEEESLNNYLNWLIGIKKNDSIGES